jgi:hypothetical protein
MLDTVHTRPLLIIYLPDDQFQARDIHVAIHPLILGKRGNSVDETCPHFELLLGFP